MKISTRLKIAALVPTMMAAVIGSALLFSYSSVRKAQANIKTAGNIVSDTNELSSLTTEYILYREDRPKQQFMEVHDSIMRLTAIRFRNPEQQQLLDTIVGNSESMKGLFQKLVSNHDLSSPDKSDVPLREAEQRLAGQLILRLRQVAADAARLQMLTQDEISATQTRTNGIIVFVIVISALPLTFVLSRTRRNITSSLATFRRGTEVIASGNLTHRIGIEERDEIGELSRAFDLMTEQLGDITVSRDELSREVDERKRAEEALRESEERLRLFIEHAPASLAMFDHSMRYLSASSRWLTDYNLGQTDLIGLSHYEVFPEIPEYWKEVHRRGLAGEVVRADADRFDRTDGSVQWLRWEVRPWHDAAGDVGGIVIFSEDITERKRAEDALHDKEATLSGILDAAKESIWLFSPDGFVITANETALVLYGKSVSEVIGKHYTEILRTELAHSRLEHLREAVELERAVEFEDQRNGIYFHHNLYPVLDAEERVTSVVCFSRDITERKRMEDELRKSRDQLELRVQERTADLEKVNHELLIEIQERRRADEAVRASEREFRLLADAMPQIVWITRPDGWNIYFNQRWLDYTGQTLEESYGHGWNKPFHPDDQQRAWDAWQNATKNGAVYDLECRLRRADGVYGWWLIRGVPVLDERGTVLKWFGTCTDIDERKRNAEKVEAERLRFYEVLETLPVYVCLLTPDYHVPFANRVFRERFGESTGLRCFEHLFGRSEPCEVCETYKVLKTMAPHEWEWTGPDSRNYSVFDFPFTDTDGSSLILEMGIDITERKQAEAELTATVARLELVNAELQEFAFVASHDLQEPLRKIQTFCDLAQKRGAPVLDSTSKEYLDRVVNSASRMRLLLHDLLEFSRVATRPEPFQRIDLVKIVLEAADVFEASVKETGCQIEVENIPAIEADESQMLRLFQNLIGNALKFRGGEAPRIKVYGKLDRKRMCEIFVKDNGIGFDPQFAERIFKPFQRLHNRNEYDGTGMGLAICRKIVERHGGSIRAESVQGKGSAFIIRLPVKQDRLEGV